MRIDPTDISEASEILITGADDAPALWLATDGGQPIYVDQAGWVGLADLGEPEDAIRGWMDQHGVRLPAKRVRSIAAQVERWLDSLD